MGAAANGATRPYFIRDRLHSRITTCMTFGGELSLSLTCHRVTACLLSRLSRTPAILTGRHSETVFRSIEFRRALS